MKFSANTKQLKHLEMVCHEFVWNYFWIGNGNREERKKERKKERNP
jgi:hypothetical protein